MASPLVRADTRAQVEARLVLGLAVACVVAFVAFVVVPYYVTDMVLPSGVAALWMLGMMFSVVLGPVAAGLAGYASFVALWLHGDALPTSARRLHLITLLLAVMFLALIATWGGEVLSGWAD